MDLKRILALDIGLKRTGVAASDEMRLIATPITFVDSTHKPRWAEQIAELSEQYEVAEIVVGIPLNQHGEEGTDAQKIREYIAVLQRRISLPVIEWDERFTTVQAERSLIAADLSRKKRKDVIDKTAAAILLQSYLDHLRFHIRDETWEEN